LLALDFLPDYERAMRCDLADRISSIVKLRRGEISAHEYLLMFTVIDTLGSMEDFIKQPIDGEKGLQLYLEFCPGGWLYHDQIDLSRFFQENVFPHVNASKQRVYPEQCKLWDVKRANPDPSIHDKIVGVWCFGGGEERFAEGQTARNEAIVACALERYRIRYGQYPDSTEALSPEFIRDIPHDVIDGNPLRYRRATDGQFVLYSVGWDEIDDGGAVDKQTRSWGRKGDWVWSYPPAESKGN
jgi:hypothetical protein